MIDRLEAVSAVEYASFFPDTSTAFASVDFNSINAGKAEQVIFIVGFDASLRPEIGGIFGLRDGIWRTPFSAPMAALTWKKDLSLASIQSFFEKLYQFLSPIPFRIVLPPDFIDCNMLAKISGILTNMTAELTADFNYHYNLNLFPDFENHLSRAARKNFRQALNARFEFEQTDIARAYAIIKANRSAKGYYLAMTLDDLEATANVIDIDAFILTLDNTDIAAAIVYRITPEIAHVVYWGDIPGFEQKRPMNMLPYHIFNHYHRLGFSAINIGTSSTDGVPNHGLCNFKESLGCTTSTILTATVK